MRQLFLLALTATSVMHASSFAYASCTYGSATQTNEAQTNANFSSTQCSAPVVDSNGQEGVVLANAITAAQLVTKTQAQLDGDINVVAQFIVPLTANWSSAASMGNSLELASTGPERAGFVQFSFQTDGTGYGTAPGYFDISDGVHHYSYQQSANATLPFDLGSQFQVSISANASIGGVNPPPPDFERILAGAHVSLSLLEANGTRFVPLFITPEPATWALLMLGACGLLCRFRGPLLRRWS